MKRWALAVALLLAVFALSACSAKAPEKKEIAFADVGWDSIRYANAIAGLVAEEVYGYDWREVSGSTPITHEALKKGEVDVHMEIWTANLPSYQKDLDENQFVELGVNFDDNAQGFYIPRYLIYGDASRGIAPLAPDLKYVWQLKDYARLFSDDERANRGRIYGGIPGWEIDDIMYKKFLHYGLNDCYEYVRPGTDAAMSAALVSAYDKGLPIVAYYWEPTWILGKYDFILLEDEPYEPVGFKNGETTCPSVRVTTGVSNEFYKDNPEFCEFLSKYRSSSKTISKALAYMEDQNADYEQTARWFLQENPQLIDEWLSPENAKTLKAALNDEDKSKKNPLLDFPFEITIDSEKIDSAVRGFSVRYAAVFDAIKWALTAFVSGIRAVLDFIPWWILILGVVLLGRWLAGKWRSGISYGIMLFLIGMFGLWNLMNETLAIVLAGTTLALLFGLPIGILASGSRCASKILRPILDTMQTMPVFVYLIPAVIFFGMGSAPAVIATVIYAIVPVIRLTGLGIRRVDKDIIEAAKAFGATRMQILLKVQIPQALPTIMAGINQTMMMAMAMVVTCSMIGARGLGNEVLIAVNRTEITRGLVCGAAVVMLAILLDRITQGRFGEKRANRKQVRTHRDKQIPN